MSAQRSSSISGRGRQSEPLRGSESARIFTPPLRKLTPLTSAGFECIEFAQDVLGIDLLPWQKWVLIHALELRADGSFRFRTVLLLVARQNGKSTLLLVLALWRMFVCGSPLVIGTAQNLDLSEELWSQATDIVESIPELAALVAHVDRSSGKKALRLTTGERYKIAAASRRGGRGLSGDLVLLDELREHQNWDAWGAVSKTTLARALAQIWAASNAGDSASIVLKHLRSIAHEMLDFPDGRDGMQLAPADDEADTGTDDSFAIYEFSAAPHRSVWDRDGWREANPALGYLIAESAIVAAARTDPETVFRTEVLCQFVNVSTLGPFPAGAWHALLVDRVARDADRAFEYCVDVSHDRTMSHVGIAFYDTEGVRRVEIAASRAGTDWVVPWLLSAERAVPVKRIALQSNGAPVSSLLDAIDSAGIEVVPWHGPDLARACGAFFDAVIAETRSLTHGAQPVLDVAAQTARTKPLGDGWAIDRRSSPEDAAPLMAVIGALWLLSIPERAFVSAYDSDDLVMI